MEKGGACDVIVKTVIPFYTLATTPKAMDNKRNFDSYYDIFRHNASVAMVIFNTSTKLSSSPEKVHFRDGLQTEPAEVRSAGCTAYLVARTVVDSLDRGFASRARLKVCGLSKVDIQGDVIN